VFTDVAKQRGASRLGFAVRAGYSFIVIALLGGAAFFIRYQILIASSPTKYGFWTLAGGGFIALWGASSGLWFGRRAPRVRVFIAACLGLQLGVLWTFIVHFPMGLFPGWMVLPTIVFWPFSGAIAFAYATALLPQNQERAPVRVGPMFALTAIGWVFFVKGGLNHVGQPLDSARMIAPRRLRTPLGVAALDRGHCIDPVPPRVAIALDSAARLTPLGNFTDVPRAAVSANAIGHSIRLWQSGAQTLGIISTWLGRGPGSHAWIENVSLDAHGRLRFDAFYGDGFFDHFEGEVKRGRLRGQLTTADALCVRRVVARAEITLRRSELPRRLPFAAVQPSTFGEFLSAFARAR
jgi:hypothetical protein